MINLLKKIWAGWKKFAHALGRVQTMILLTIIYFVIIPVFSLLRFKDPLRKRLGAASYWQTFQTRAISLDNFRRMF
jgi:hypothetical protein